MNTVNKEIKEAKLLFIKETVTDSMRDLNEQLSNPVPISHNGEVYQQVGAEINNNVESTSVDGGRRRIFCENNPTVERTYTTDIDVLTVFKQPLLDEIKRLNNRIKELTSGK